LTWDDLERWAGGRSVTRGRSYQRGGRVKDLRISKAGELLATVVGGDRYTTRVALMSGDRRTKLKSSCTCPVGYNGCKHAVAVVAEYLQIIADGREIPVAGDDDPRWAKLRESTAELEDDWDDHEESDDEDWSDDDQWDEEEAIRPPSAPKPAKKPAQPAPVNWNQRIEQEIRKRSREELADLVWSLTQRFPELYQEFRERIALREGDVKHLVAEARGEIKKVTSEHAWRSGWTGEGHTPDFSRIQHRLERLLELGHADEVVSLGRELIESGFRQVGESDDEGDTASELRGCLPIVFEAVTRSSLSGPERLLFAIDADLADDYDLSSEASEAVFEAHTRPEDWSMVADTLLGRLKAAPVGDLEGVGRYSRNYHREQIANWAARALHDSGREGELQALYESEARAAGSYERLVKLLMEQRRFEDAERWAREGIAAESRKGYGGYPRSLIEILRELAEQRTQWDVVAAHAAYPFFENPSPAGFRELVKAARKAKVEEPVRAAALHFLETGKKPYQVVARPDVPKYPGRMTATARKKAATTRRTSTSPEPPQAPSVQIDRTWPLPVPDYLVPLLDRRGGYRLEPHPHLEVLLQMAIDDKRPDEVLRWYDRMASQRKGHGYYGGAGCYTDRVAAAVADSHLERAIAIYRDGLNAQLPHAQPSAYESAAAYLRKLKPIYQKLNREDEWTALIASIRETYANRPRFMDVLDGVEGRTIVQSARPWRPRRCGGS
jgi:uncharacterized Zn finger protein